MVARMARTIIFGDVHGCHEEWRDLLDLLAVTSDDTLVSVGDLVARGPSSRKTLELARSLPNLRCVLGNHEVRCLQRWSDGGPPIDDNDRTMREDLGEARNELLAWVDTWPYAIEDDDWIVIHAGLRPGIPLSEQTPEDLTRLRTLGESGPAWHEHYDGEKLVIYGHWAAAGLTIRPRTIGLDSGCVYGGRLSACLLPERRIVSVPARRMYVDPFADQPR